ncbi:MAG: DUF3833 domain-containing protein [Burkholderiales bacterium]|nr:DUF3833 domain-containing protein [Burkholderiales bacterium]
MQDFKAEQPAFDLRQYFDGTIDAWGIVRNRDGSISQRFTVVIQASWQGDTGTLDEQFTYSDQRTQRRVWTFKRVGERWIGTAADVVGEAVGEEAGNAFRLGYVLDFPYGSGTVHLNVDDWMYRMDDKVILNRSSISKLGIEMAQVFISFRKRD